MSDEYQLGGSASALSLPQAVTYLGFRASRVVAAVAECVA